MITIEVIRLCIKAVDAGCSVLPIFLRIRANPACVIALQKANERPSVDNCEVLLSMLMGSIIK